MDKSLILRADQILATHRRSHYFSDKDKGAAKTIMKLLQVNEIASAHAF